MRAALSTEQKAVLGELERFVVGRVEPAVARPERPMPRESWHELVAELEQLGLAGCDDEPSGLAPWEGLCDERPLGITLATLTRLARACPALGLVAHRRALARAVTRRARLEPSRAPELEPAGRHGLGREALARALAGQPPSADDEALLADVYAPRATRVVPLDPGFESLLTFAWIDGALMLRSHSRAELSMLERAHGHGLDELSLALVTAEGEGARSPLSPEASRALARDALAAHALGLVALALGASLGAHELARRYAASRRQGGALIDRHPAVAGLLGAASATHDTTRAALETFDAEPLAEASLPRALSLRASLGPRLCDATNAAMQVLGGVGYMREAGVERLVRAQNGLRAQAGSPRELRLVVAEWERLHA
jgi:acyl-CoA dehydrogenase